MRSHRWMVPENGWPDFRIDSLWCGTYCRPLEVSGATGGFGSAKSGRPGLPFRVRSGQGTLLPRRARSTCRAICHEGFLLDRHFASVDCRRRLRHSCLWHHAKRLTPVTSALQSHNDRHTGGSVQRGLSAAMTLCARPAPPSSADKRYWASRKVVCGNSAKKSSLTLSKATRLINQTLGGNE
jgi:hypothetical protein